MTVLMRRCTAAALVLVVELSATTRLARADGGAQPSTQPAGTPPAKKIPQERSQQEILDKERAEAKAAALTPILPSPHDPTKPAYQLYTQIDIPILGIGAVLAASRFLRTQPAFCAPLCDKATLNPLDRLTAGNYDPGWSIASDIGLYSIMGGSILLLLIDEGFWPGLNDLVVVAETGLLATALSTLATIAVSRPRPLLYGTKAPLALRNGQDAGLSFISGHATVVFAIAVSSYMTQRRMHPEKGSMIPLVVALCGLGAAAFVASARVVAGMHFLTDALGGAIIGSAVGILIPSMHGSPVKLLPQVSAQGAQLNLFGEF